MNVNVSSETQVRAHSARWESTHQMSIDVENEADVRAASHSSQYTAENVWNATHQAKHIPSAQCPTSET